MGRGLQGWVPAVSGCYRQSTWGGGWGAGGSPLGTGGAGPESLLAAGCPTRWGLLPARHQVGWRTRVGAAAFLRRGAVWVCAGRYLAAMFAAACAANRRSVVTTVAACGLFAWVLVLNAPGVVGSNAGEPAVSHPHNPKAVVLHGAGGKVATLNWFTVPFNAEKVAGLTTSDWHLGFAWLDVHQPLMVGKGTVPPHSYKFDVRRNDAGKFTHLVLTPKELDPWRRPRGESRADQEARVARAREELRAKGIPTEVLIPVTERKGQPDAEHLEMVALTRGYARESSRSPRPTGGAAFELWLDFGPYHVSGAVGEVWPLPDPDADRESK